MAPAWLIPNLLLATLVAGVGATIAWIRSGAPRGGPPPPSHWGLTGGLALLAVALFSPLAPLAAGQLLTAHLIQVTLVMGGAPPLLLMSLPRRSGHRPPEPLPSVGRLASQPAVALLLVNAVFFAWHAAAPYDASIRLPWLYAVQQATLLLVSLAFWWPIVGPRASSRRAMSPFLKLGYILVATIPHTFAGMTLALARHPLYAAYAAAPRALGIGVMTDQQVAGACMALLSKLALFAAFSIVMVRMLSDGPADEDDGDDHRRPDGPDAPIPLVSPSPRPEWLDLVESGDTVPEPERSREPTAV